MPKITRTLTVGGIAPIRFTRDPTKPSPWAPAPGPPDMEPEGAPRSARKREKPSAKPKCWRKD